jgi:hypothetical protein
MRYQKLKAFIPSTLFLIAAHHAWGNTMRCGNGLIEVGKSMATVQALCGSPADVQHSVAVNAKNTAGADGSTRNTVNDEVPVETWTYNRGPNQLMVSIRFVDGKVVAIDTLHEYGH